MHDPVQEILITSCKEQLDGLITSMNDALAVEMSRTKLIELSSRISSGSIPHSFAILSRGRMFYFEDDVNCTCSDPVSFWMRSDRSLKMGIIMWFCVMM